MRTIITVCYLVAIIWAFVGIISFPILVLTDGNYWLAVPIIFSAEIPAFIGLGLAVTNYLLRY